MVRIFYCLESFEGVDCQLVLGGYEGCQNRDGLLKVLDNPLLPLHNNLSERDIRDYVKKRKISGSTRSENGRKARDTFASIKKTCRKLGISFYDYLKDRLMKLEEIPCLGSSVQGAMCRSG